jgi:uncharacterized membrane protein
MTGAFLALWAVPAATNSIAVFIVVFGLTYVFANWGPNTTTFMYPAGIFPVTTRPTCYGITAAAGKLGGV